MTTSSRFAIRMDPWWRPLLLPGGALPDSSYVELSDDALSVRFGWLFNHAIARTEIEGAAARDWPLWMGVGWRTTFRGLVGLIGSYQGVVEVRLRTPARAWGLVSYDRLAVSLEGPGRFLAALAPTPP